MIKYFVIALMGATTYFGGSKAMAATSDSINVTTQNSIRLIRHRVVAKENIYSVSRKYQVPVTKITQANPGLKTLVVDQVILIPVAVTKSETKPTWPKQKTSVVSQAGAVQTGKPATLKPTGPALYDGQGNRVHKVDSKQTLYAISRMYGVSTTDLKKWNNLSNDNVVDNQTLIVKLNSQSQQPIVTPAIAPVNPVKPESSTVVNAPAIVSRPVIISTQNAGNQRTDTVAVASAPRETFSRVSENGLAELIGNGISGNKYLALHKTAPIGSFVTVRNLMNNQTVSVRVIGKLPDIGSNEKVIVKISKRAFQRLGAIDNRFLVEIEYEVADKILSSNQ